MKTLPLRNENAFLLFRRPFTQNTVYVPSDPLADATCSTKPGNFLQVCQHSGFKRVISGGVQWIRLLLVPD